MKESKTGEETRETDRNPNKNDFQKQFDLGELVFSTFKASEINTKDRTDTDLGPNTEVNTPTNLSNLIKFNKPLAFTGAGYLIILDLYTL